MIAVCVPTASIVTMLPLISRSFNNSGIAVISFVFESTGSCASINPRTVSTTFSSIGVVSPFVFSVAPHNAFPSIARWVFLDSTISPIHSIKAYKANSSSMPFNIRVIVEGEAIPYFKFICFRSSSKWVLHHFRLLRIVVRPQRNPRVTHTSISPRSCLFSLPHR